MADPRSTAIAVVGADRVLAPRLVAATDGVLVAPGQPLPEGVRRVVWVGPASSSAPAREPTGTGVVADAAGLTALLERAPSIEAVVIVSSAMVYGAEADNAVPLAEDAPRRADRTFAPVARFVALEDAAFAFAEAHPDVAVSVLRPALVVSGERALARASPWSGRERYARDLEPPVQYVHVDDVAAAAAARRPGVGSGAWNVAPDGWSRRAHPGPRRAPGARHRGAGDGGPAGPLAAAVAPACRTGRADRLPTRLVGGRQRPAARPRVVAATHQRGGLRAGVPRRAAGTARRPPPSGAGARGRGGGGGVGRRCRRPALAPQRASSRTIAGCSSTSPER
ncbi:MAG: hypothetical protein R2690_14150 [Acidimicrobiales bacterium]